LLTLAAGSVLYVIIQLLGVAAKRPVRRPGLVAACITLGLLAGFATTPSSPPPGRDRR